MCKAPNIVTESLLVAEHSALVSGHVTVFVCVGVKLSTLAVAVQVFAALVGAAGNSSSAQHSTDTRRGESSYKCNAGQVSISSSADCTFLAGIHSIVTCRLEGMVQLLCIANLSTCRPDHVADACVVTGCSGGDVRSNKPMACSPAAGAAVPA
jgi:hypothetical protein